MKLENISHESRGFALDEIPQRRVGGHLGHVSDEKVERYPEDAKLDILMAISETSD